MTTPTKLYHYTTINNLALILESQSIRFGRLDKVNDPSEGMSSDFKSMASYMFISSWTSNDLENLALWNMYTPSMRGVRIELPLPIFSNQTIGKHAGMLVSDKEWINEELGIFIIGAQNKPFAIIYTDDDSLLKPTIRKTQGLQVDSLGKYKHTIWSIEQEYRFVLNITPIDKNVNSQNFADRYSHLIANGTPPSIDGYFVKIDKTAFHNMKIRLGPKMSNGDNIIVKSLLEKYNSNAIMENSVLEGMVR